MAHLGLGDLDLALLATLETKGLPGGVCAAAAGDNLMEAVAVLCGLMDAVAADGAATGSGVSALRNSTSAVMNERMTDLLVRAGSIMTPKNRESILFSNFWAKEYIFAQEMINKALSIFKRIMTRNLIFLGIDQGSTQHYSCTGFSQPLAKNSASPCTSAAAAAGKTTTGVTGLLSALLAGLLSLLLAPPRTPYTNVEVCPSSSQSPEK